MYTRKQYMNSECNHREYYGQFVNSNVIDAVNLCIGKDRILSSNDEHFNDIALSNWDNMNLTIRALCGRSIAKANDNGGDNGGISLSDTVCTAKEAARQIKVGAKQ